MSEWVPDPSHMRDAETITPLMRTGMEPQWRELRDHLQTEGVDLAEAVVTEWVTEGGANMGATVATRDGRVFDVMIVMGYDRERHRVADNEGYVTSFREVPAEKITTTSSGRPNSWLQAARIARMVLDKGPRA